MNKLLLPFAWKWMGVTLLAAGAVTAGLYFAFDFNFTLPVFAVYSQYLETKTFTTFSTHFADELIMLLFVAGMGFIIFSKERNESQELDLIRATAFAKALLVNTALLICCILFVYGIGFIAALVFNMISLQVLYLLFFYLEKRRKV